VGELSGFKPELDEGGAITQDSAFNFRHDFLSHPLLEMPKPRKSFSALAIGSWSSPTPVIGQMKTKKTRQDANTKKIMTATRTDRTWP